MEAEKIRQLIISGRVYDLGMEYYVGMPHHPNHPPFAFSLTKLHGEVIYGDGVSASNCLFTTGGHTGTHFDALGHIARNGRVTRCRRHSPLAELRGAQESGNP